VKNPVEHENIEETEKARKYTALKAFEGVCKQ